MSPDTVLKVGFAVLALAIILVGVLLSEHRPTPAPYDPDEAYEPADRLHHDYTGGAR
jgi:hypothetical protein